MKTHPYWKLGFFALLVVLLAFLLLTNQEPTAVTATNEPAETTNLSNKLTEILDDPLLDGTTTGVSVRDADTGALLFSHAGDHRLHPASNMKLLTTVAALEKLGPDYQFTTEVLTDGKLKGNVLQGNLYLKGKGDPTLQKTDLDRLAADLNAAGIKTIKGDLIGDDSWYDDVRLSQDLNWSDESFYTGAQVSALSLSPNEDYDAGTVIVEVYPGEKPGEKPIVKLIPETDYVTIANNANTVNTNHSKTINIEREHGSNTIVIDGEIPLQGSRARTWIAVWEPTGYVLDVFQKSLAQHGMTFYGNSTTTIGKTPAKATVLTSRNSMPLSDLLIPFMKLSNNGHGELLTKEMGKVIYGEGSWDRGLQVIKDVVTKFGVNGESTLFRDGSGMSHKNLIPANNLSYLLYAVQEADWFPDFKQSLPVAGNAERMVGGTLRNRMTDGLAANNVLAKTGSLTGVSSLSGYVTTKDGKRLTFSILINNYLGNSSTITAIEDKIATVLANHEF
ncbi:D-alanyl-D-alanine carboxypeptidase/D-alanyl-D-alanine endopeptidase [Ornithinibacillus contaminans]|uniref:D-alanyl-D-alanine carboxypeptidase/D-alanyl-D-alanine endopeptidase n=1 Tax=Ornithinibacillus contaminans TaxID=694055 RepID=UPI00064DFD6C|nr:D-alanyl-D-alanine carboxypeptidase/D-alanyl-D-alanine-endopeptidase [Ornithinibacillus contaminans]